ncbi:hypothetical protein [Streptomyces solaniscabiei]|uniref:hypothetical protein n=1 Tax=Streptomyces solaniscabiei TaxID=2683255 RepID=UPI001CE2AECF|nr:hypothetical protein [Streptomyces solaniscabiei]
MPTIALLVVFLLVLVFTLVCGALIYVAHRHPASREPLLVGLAAMAVLAALVTPIITR